MTIIGLGILILTAASIVMAHAVIFFAVAHWLSTPSVGKHTGAPWYVLYYDWLEDRGDIMNIFGDRNLTKQQREEKSAKKARSKKARDKRKAERARRRKNRWLF